MPCNIVKKKLFFQAPKLKNTEAPKLNDQEETEKQMFPVIVGYNTNKPITSQIECLQAQSIICESLGIDDLLTKLPSLCTGNCPSDISSHIDENGNKYILWFALTVDNHVVIIDLTKWIAFPNFYFDQFPCLWTKNCKENKKKRVAASVANISERIDKNAKRMSSDDYKVISDELKNLYELE
tara:strand:+ start:521 stop:1066 length:546 start_codon:yes stop_codon:yes gene_type:complete